MSSDRDQHTPPSTPSASRPSHHDPGDQPGDQPNFTGRQVIDEHGESLGSIDDVLFDPSGGAPEYFVVKPGLLRRAHYLPVGGSYRSIDGDIVVPWDLHWFKRSPSASRDHVLSTDTRRQVEAHYADR